MQPSEELPPLRVMVVEDEPAMAECLALLLRRWGHEATAAYDGPDALREVPTFKPEAVLLDIGLPCMEGYEVARRIRQLPGMKKCLLVALSGHGHEDDLRRCKEAGIDCHFVKPVDPSELRDVLAKAEWLGPERRQLAC